MVLCIYNMCVCICVFVGVHMCLESEIKLRYFLLALAIRCLRQAFSLACNLPRRLGWLASKSQGFNYLCHPSARITSMCLYAWLFISSYHGFWYWYDHRQAFYQMNQLCNKISYVETLISNSFPLFKFIHQLLDIFTC